MMILLRPLQQTLRSRALFIQTNRLLRSSVIYSHQIGYASSTLAIRDSSLWFQASTKTCFSTTTIVASSLSRYGFGGHKWRKIGPNYPELIATSLQKGVTLFEAGQEGGDEALAQAYRAAVERNPSLLLGHPNHPQQDDNPQNQKVTMTARLGYRTVTMDQNSNEADNENDTGTKKPQDDLFLPGDVQVEEYSTSDESNEISKVLHNTSSDYMYEILQESPLVQLRRDYPEHIRLVYMIQNPEVQVLELLKNQEDGNELPSLEKRQDFIRSRIATAIQGLEQGIQEGILDSYGIVSNGLGLPSDHPLHLSHEVLVQLLQQNESSQHFTTVQLPANLLETQGLDVARKLQTSSSNSLDILAMRPLTCYPDLGTGTGHPFGLVDFKLPALDGKSSMQYTNEMDGPPAIYQVAMQTALSHFDADEIITAKQEGKKLTTEERETLDGCKLLQSMIHDLDNDLETIRSFDAHEAELYDRIIPLIYDTFENFDESTGDVLQAFFAAYGVAVRYAIAKRTRQLLKTGEEGDTKSNSSDKNEKGSNGSGGNKTATKSNTTYPDIPDSMRLQEFALRRLLEEPSISRVIVGATTREDLLEDLDIIETIAHDPSSFSPEKSEEVVKDNN